MKKKENRQQEKHLFPNHSVPCKGVLRTGFTAKSALYENPSDAWLSFPFYDILGRF